MSRLRRAMTEDNKLTGMSVERLGRAVPRHIFQRDPPEMDDDYAAYNRLYPADGGGGERTEVPVPAISAASCFDFTIIRKLKFDLWRQWQH